MGALTAMGFDVQTVTPATWKKGVKLAGKQYTKDDSREAASRNKLSRRVRRRKRVNSTGRARRGSLGGVDGTGDAGGGGVCQGGFDTSFETRGQTEAAPRPAAPEARRVQYVITVRSVISSGLRQGDCEARARRVVKKVARPAPALENGPGALGRPDFPFIIATEGLRLSSCSSKRTRGRARRLRCSSVITVEVRS